MRHETHDREYNKTAEQTRPTVDEWHNQGVPIEQKPEEKLNKEAINRKSTIKELNEPEVWWCSTHNQNTFHIAVIY